MNWKSLVEIKDLLFPLQHVLNWKLTVIAAETLMSEMKLGLLFIHSYNFVNTMAVIIPISVYASCAL